MKWLQITMGTTHVSWLFKTTGCVGVWEGCAIVTCLWEKSDVKTRLTTAIQSCTKRLGKGCIANFLKATGDWRDGSVTQALAALPKDHGSAPHIHNPRESNSLS